MTPVFVTNRKPVQQVLDGDESGALEVGGTARTDAFEVLKGGREQIVAQAGDVTRPESDGSLLNDDGPARFRLDLTNPCRQREWFVEADSSRILRCP
jgi:hypothetical protein